MGQTEVAKAKLVMGTKTLLNTHADRLQTQVLPCSLEADQIANQDGHMENGPQH
jgi:hypothetical protein